MMDEKNLESRSPRTETTLTGTSNNFLGWALLRRLRQENRLNPEGRVCSELKSCHCTPTWVRETERQRQRERERVQVRASQKQPQQFFERTVKELLEKVLTTSKGMKKKSSRIWSIWASNSPIMLSAAGSMTIYVPVS